MIPSREVFSNATVDYDYRACTNIFSKNPSSLAILTKLTLHCVVWDERIRCWLG